MTSTPRLMRTLMVGAVVLALASASTGCNWFKSKTKSNYSASRETQPLEVPPGLNLPDTSAATALPSVASASGTPSASGVASDITLPGSSASNFPRIGSALEGIEGVVINGRAEALGSFDVTYQGQNFLVRVQDSAGASRMIALSPDGRILTRGPAATLLAAIKAKL